MADTERITVILPRATLEALVVAARADSRSAATPASHAAFSAVACSSASHSAPLPCHVVPVPAAALTCSTSQPKDAAPQLRAAHRLAVAEIALKALAPRLAVRVGNPLDCAVPAPPAFRAFMNRHCRLLTSRLHSTPPAA